MKYRMLILALATSAMAASASAATVKIGALYPFSGGLASLGQESFRGLELAVNQRNAAGGVNGQQIELVKVDAVDPNQAVAGAKQLVSDEVAAIFGTYASGLSYAATPVAELAGIPYFELGAVSQKITTRGYQYLFRSNSTTVTYGTAILDTLRDSIAPGMGLKPEDIRIGIIHEDGPYGSDVAATEEAHAKELGLKVVEKLPYSAKAVDLSSLILRLKGSDANVVLQTSYQNDSVLYFRQAKEANFNPTIVIGAGGGYSLVDTAKAVGPDINGVFDMDFPQITINPAGAPGLDRFLADYQSTYNGSPQSGHSLANYVGAVGFLEAMDRAGSFDKDKVRAAVMAYEVPVGQTANGWGFKFDEDGQNTRADLYLMQWQDGVLKTIAPENVAQAEPIYKH
ncbi:ABC transporter substrate-binding protein [Castellaniella sp.]|uniref:ABC transporter substrate-binding protein n=1 Tax=Castellaniella sp. TaxID=1955812 RepID=UPI00355D2A3B